MRIKYIIIVLLFIACNSNEQKSDPVNTDTLQNNPTTIQDTQITKTEPVIPGSKTYANKRFRNVSVERVGENAFQIRGEGQIFEANFNWIVEDGHEELKKGFQMTDAGAPEWGKFEFTIDVEKKRENSTLMLILFESSAKDGSRQHELPILLY